MRLVKDRYGLSWQVVPRRLYELLSHPDPAGGPAATEPMYACAKSSSPSSSGRRRMASERKPLIG